MAATEIKHCNRCCPHPTALPKCPKVVRLTGNIYAEDRTRATPDAAFVRGYYEGLLSKQGDTMKFHGELSGTAEKVAVDPFAENGLGGRIAMMIPITAFEIKCETLIVCETVRPERCNAKCISGVFRGKGWLRSHPRPSTVDIDVVYTYEQFRKVYRIVAIDFELPWEAFETCYELNRISLIATK